MRRFTLTLASFLFFVVVGAQKKNLTNDEPSSFRLDEGTRTENNNKTSEKRALGGIIEPKVSSFVPNKYDRSGYDSNIETDSNGQERALEEKTLRDFLPYDSIQNFLLKIIRPEAPILDTASDSEKYARNYGNGAEALGEFIVRGTETISRALNTVLDVPKKAFSKLSTGATQALNQIGAYIVGL